MRSKGININTTLFTLLCVAVLIACNNQQKEASNETGTRDEHNADTLVVKPVFITEPVEYDSDDPAIWVNAVDVSKSLVVGTDKDQDGALYTFDLKGKNMPSKKFYPLQRPNNVDVQQGVPNPISGGTLDIAVVAERNTHKFRILRMPDLKPLDMGGIEAFVGEQGEMKRDLMGVAVYQNPASQETFVVIGRKTGPQDSTYLWQYRLNLVSDTLFKANLVRKFGYFSGRKEIEAIMIDDAAGLVYYCDEQVGVRMYYADPAKGNTELAFFGQQLFADDNEGIALYPGTNGEGYIFISDQAASKLQVFSRHKRDADGKPLYIGFVQFKAVNTDGIEIYAGNLGAQFPKGLLVAMSDDKTFHYYSMETILEHIQQ
jgi:3-phytase